MGKNAGMREEDAQWTSSQKAAILVLLTTGDLLHQQAYQVFMIKVFLFSFFFFGVESPNKYGEKVLQFSDLMLLMHIINWENWRPFLIALEVVFMSIHGDASKSLKNNIKREKKLLTCSCPWHLSSLCLCEWCSLLIFLNYFLSLYFCFWDLSFIG